MSAVKVKRRPQTSSNKKLLVAKGITSSSKKLLVPRALLLLATSLPFFLVFCAAFCYLHLVWETSHAAGATERHGAVGAVGAAPRHTKRPRDRGHGPSWQIRSEKKSGSRHPIGDVYHMLKMAST